MTEQTSKRLKEGKKIGGRPQVSAVERLPEGWEDIILAQCAEGASDVEIRAHLCLLTGKFDHNAWYTLEARDKDFKETLKKGEVLCKAWWIKQGRTNMKHYKDDVFETALWFINMKNRFGWQDKVEIEHGVADKTLDKFAEMNAKQLQEKAYELANKRSIPSVN